MAERKYLNEDQQAQLEAMLKAQSVPDEQPSPEQEIPAPVEDTTPVDSGMTPNAPDDPASVLLGELGMSSVEELVERYKERDGKATEYKDMLTQMLAYQQALDNESELETDDPMNTVKKAVRAEMAPLLEKLQADARNKVVQEAWGKDAREMPDIADVMPEITQFIAEHPDLAVANDGLRRAYDSVRSRKYKTEAQMLSDSDFVQRMASNEKIKEAVLKEQLGELARNGEKVPSSIGDGGGTPLSGQRQAPNSMEQARRGLSKMLGLK